MSETTFLHGVELIEISDGPRPIQTVASSVIGIVGTAPNSVALVMASLAIGTAIANNGITLTAVPTGTLGNAVSLELVDPEADSQALAVTVAGTAISVSLATDADGVITTTATALLAALTTAAPNLVTAAATGASTGAGLVAAFPATKLSGGVDEAFPLNTPVLVAGSLKQAALLGQVGTLPAAMASILDQIGAVVVVVRVAKGVSDAATLANVLGGVDGVTGQFNGLQAFLGAESALGYAPRILCAPGFTHTRDTTANAVVAALIPVAERLRAVVIADGPNTTDADAIQYAGDFGSDRVFVVDPGVLKTNTTTGMTEGQFASACVAGLIAKTDNALGFWWSPSNQEIDNIVGTQRSVDFVLGDSSSRANLLNGKNVATIIRQQGYRLWGNRTLSSDPKFAFLSVRRTADIIQDSLQRAHLWAVDRNITKTYVQDVVDGVNAYLRNLVAIGAILGGKCWADPDLNTPDQIAQGHVYFDFDFTPPYPAEHITFRSHMVQDYLTQIFA